jgi:hypothetical protein
LNIKESIPSKQNFDNSDLSKEVIEIEIDRNKNLKCLPDKKSNREIRIYSETSMMTNSIRRHLPKEDIINKYKNYDSYQEAVKLLKSIKKYRVPFEKMMLIASITTEITESVNNFWKDLEKLIPTSLLNIDADQLMTIFIFIIIKSQISELLVHSKFVKEFTTSTTRSTMMGYYYTTLEACLIYISSINDKSDFLRR